jgi:phosphoribosylformylglycinamidine synthase
LALFRDLGLFRCITDNGAGGISCSVAEMARECGGCRVELEKVPVKYAGMAPWEIWISESQERMTLAVPPEKWPQLKDLLARRGVEATVIGEFTASGRCQVSYAGTPVMDMELDFLHDGLPKKQGDCSKACHAMTDRRTKGLAGKSGSHC